MNPPTRLSLRLRPAAEITASLICHRTRPIRFVALLAILLTSSSSWSQTAAQPDQTRRPATVPTATEVISSKQQLYGGMSLGAAHNQDVVSSNNDGTLSSVSAKKTSPAWSAFGGFQFNQHVGVESGYQDLGKSSFRAQSSGGVSWSPGRVGTDYETTGWFLDGVVAVPIAPRWTLFARVGAFRWKTKETFFEESSGTSVDKDSGMDARYGVGLQRDVGRDNYTFWRWDLTQSKVDPTGDRISTIGMSIIRRF